jgi:hypothetical protein
MKRSTPWLLLLPSLSLSRRHPRTCRRRAFRHCKHLRLAAAAHDWHHGSRRDVGHRHDWNDRVSHHRTWGDCHFHHRHPRRPTFRTGREPRRNLAPIDDSTCRRFKLGRDQIGMLVTQITAEGAAADAGLSPREVHAIRSQRDNGQSPRQPLAIHCHYNEFRSCHSNALLKVAP